MMESCRIWIAAFLTMCAFAAITDAGRANGQASTKPSSSAASMPVGELKVIAMSPDWTMGVPMWGLETSGAEQFAKAPAGCGTVKPDALIVTLKDGPRTFKIALDSTEKDDPHFKIMRLDLSGKGDFTKAPVIKRHHMVNTRGSYQYVFGDGPVLVECSGKSFSVTVEGVYTVDTHRFTLTMQCAGVGKCLFGEKVHDIRVYDCTGNLQFNDPAKPALEEGYPAVGKGDLVMVDAGAGNFKSYTKAFYGHPVLVDGALFDVTASADGSTVSAAPRNGKTGLLKIDHPRWECALIGKKNIMVLAGGEAPVPLPEDQYAVRQYTEYSAADPKKEGLKIWFWFPNHDRFGEKPPKQPTCGIASDKTTVLAIGSPLTGEIHVKRIEKPGQLQELYITLDWSDCSGIPVNEGMVNVYALKGPIIEIKDKDGKVVGKAETISTTGTFAAFWKVPADLKGAFSLSGNGLDHLKSKITEGKLELK